MKKILSIILIILIGSTSFVGITTYKIHTEKVQNENLRKNEIKALLHKPKSYEVKNKINNIKSNSNIQDMTGSENSTSENININSNSYLVTNDYDNNVQSQKADKSIDFISDINEDINNPYNNINSLSNDSDINLLAHLIESEAGNEPYEGKLAVGSVVINRSRIDRENISTVIFTKNQFDGVNTNNFKISPSSDSIKAAKEVLAGIDIVPNAYYFANLNLCSPDFAKINTFIVRIGSHWFFKK